MLTVSYLIRWSSDTEQIDGILMMFCLASGNLRIHFVPFSKKKNLCALSVPTFSFIGSLCGIQNVTNKILVNLLYLVITSVPLPLMNATMTTRIRVRCWRELSWEFAWEDLHRDRPTEAMFINLVSTSHKKSCHIHNLISRMLDASLTSSEDHWRFSSPLKDSPSLPRKAAWRRHQICWINQSLRPPPPRWSLVQRVGLSLMGINWL